MPTYTLDQAAALLNLGRNTLTRRLRDAGVLGRDNLPAGRYRGGKYLAVKTGVFHHPVAGWTHYGRTEITDAGLDHIADRLGIAIDHLPTIHATRQNNSQQHYARSQS